MNFKEFIRFTYGLVMGTSTPFLKPTKRFLFPVHRHDFDPQLGLLLGGSCVCGLLAGNGEALLINTNQGAAAENLRQWVAERRDGGTLKLVLTSLADDFSRGTDLYAEAKRVYVGPAMEKKVSGKFGSDARLQRVASEMSLVVAGERVHLIPVGPAATDSDLAVYLESRSILFAGPLFYNGIHPILRTGEGLRPEEWIAKFEGLLARFQPKYVVPAEGDIGTIEDARRFISYLRDLVDSRVDFSTCRARYDWPEIPAYTSLEENFDLLREKVKSHTTLN